MFDDAADFKWLRGAAVELHCCSLRVSVERLDHAMQFGWATDLWENLKCAVFADQIKRLCEINESDVQDRASAVLCTSLVAVEGRRPCLLLTVQLGRHIMTPGRYAPLASGSVSV